MMLALVVSLRFLAVVFLDISISGGGVQAWIPNLHHLLQETPITAMIINKRDPFSVSLMDRPRRRCRQTRSAASSLSALHQSSSESEPTADQAFTERCIEWYKQQKKNRRKPPAAIMKLFRLELNVIKATTADFLDLQFRNMTMTNEFVDFLEDEFPDDDDLPPGYSLPTTNGFVAEYVDPKHVVDDFIGYVDDCHAAYKRNSESYNAPYICLCQSSGYGKSRLLKQVSKKRKLLYVCVGDSPFSYPPPNEKARNFFFSYNAKSDYDRVEHLRQQLERCVSWCLQNDLTTMEQFGGAPATIWDDIMVHKPRKIDSDDDDEQETKHPIWIAFDEARSLLVHESADRLSDFQILRRALKLASENIGHGIFAILVDTDSAIATFPTPRKKVDASYRRTLEGTNLFHPYILLKTHDALKDSQADFRDEWSFVGCGRPLWKALYPKPSDSEDMVMFATNKLRRATVDIISDELASLAIVICRTGVYLNPQSSMASDLAANYMATLLLCDCTHEHFLGTYLSDPAITIASARLWYQNELLEKRGLPILRQNLLYGTFLKDYSGELVARFLLLIGMDKTSKNGAYDGKWYKVSEFMKHCFGITDCLVDEEAYVGFSHFIPLVKQPSTIDDLKGLLFRRAAGCLPPQNVGADLLIPFWKETETEPLISYILIQLKNKIEGESRTEMLDNLNPRNCFAEDSQLHDPATDIVLIMMEVGITYKMSPPHSERFYDNADESQDDEEQKQDVKLQRSLETIVPAENVDSRDNWKKWAYSVRGIYPQSYPFLEGNDILMEELTLMAKGSFGVDAWMNDVETSSKRNLLSPPGLERRKEHILEIEPPIALNSSEV